MLSVARALGRNPKVLLADELSLGLAPIIVQRSARRRSRAASNERGVGVLLVEQHVRQALKIADRVYVMERGRIALSGTAEEIGGQLSEIEAAYLTAASDEESPADEAHRRPRSAREHTRFVAPSVEDQ